MTRMDCRWSYMSSSSVFVSMFGQMAVIQMDDGTKPE